MDELTTHTHLPLDTFSCMTMSGSCREYKDAQLPPSYLLLHAISHQSNYLIPSSKYLKYQSPHPKHAHSENKDSSVDNFTKT